MTDCGTCCALKKSADEKEEETLQRPKTRVWVVIPKLSLENNISLPCKTLGAVQKFHSWYSDVDTKTSSDGDYVWIQRLLLVVAIMVATLDERKLNKLENTNFSRSNLASRVEIWYFKIKLKIYVLYNPSSKIRS